jgi:hypothetical protein
MTNERADVATRDSEADCGVYQVRKEGDPILSRFSQYLSDGIRL